MRRPEDLARTRQYVLERTDLSKLPDLGAALSHHTQGRYSFGAFRGCARLQRHGGRAFDERGFPAGARGRGLRAHVERQGAVSRRPQDELESGLTRQSQAPEIPDHHRMGSGVARPATRTLHSLSCRFTPGQRYRQRLSVRMSVPGPPSGPGVGMKTPLRMCFSRVPPRHIYARPSSLMAAPAPRRFGSLISEYLRESRTPSAPARKAASTASFVPSGEDLLEV